MDEMVKKTQEWLNETYWLRKGFTKFKDEEIDGITGQGTFKRLIQALQIELNDKYNSGLTVDGDFGAGTLNALPSTIDSNYEKGNIVKIIQGSLWCKGYSAGPIDGDYGPKVTAAVKKFKEHAGVPGEGYISPYVLQGIMNTDAYFFNGESGTQSYFLHLVQKDMNSKYGFTFGLIAPNGIWERKSQKMLIKCCQKEWGISNPDGVWGNNTKSKAPILSTKTEASSFDKTRLLQWALTVNGFYPGTFSGNFTTELKNKVSDFQEFMCLEPDGIVGKGTWASLLSSKGDISRTLKAFDTASRLTKSQAIYFKNHGYTDIGRYLVNASGKNVLDKKMTIEELKYISEAGLKVFPIYQTRGNNVGYFTDSLQGLRDAAEAETAALNLLFPKGTTIYFAVDYDVKTADIEKYIVPYFINVKLGMSNYYRVGVYGPRAICNILADQGLTSASFVADMSSGFTCNIGQPMPKNWAYEQVVEVQQGGIGIDKCAISPRGTAIEWRLPNSDRINPDDYNPIDQSAINKYLKDISYVYDMDTHKFVDDKRNVVYNTLKAAGLGIYALAGFLGNIEAESFDTAMSGHDGSVGICQWRDIDKPTPGSNEGLRKTNYIAYAESRGAKTDSEKENIQYQADFILEECNDKSDYRDSLAVKAMNYLLNPDKVDCVYKAADCVTAFYERCSFYKTKQDVKNSTIYTADRYDLDKPNEFNQLFYLDTPKRRGYAEVYYYFILDKESH